MAKRRGPDGRPIDIPSQAPPQRQPDVSPGASGDVSTLPPSHGGPPGAAEGKKPGRFFPDEPPTRPAAKSPAHAVVPSHPLGASAADGPHTVVYGGGKSQKADSRDANRRDAMADPVVGWLVIIDGPGKGNFVHLGSGMNKVGRDRGQRVSLDFGDDGISRENHAIVTFDPLGRKFYIQQGTGTNLVYVGGAPVLIPTEISDRAEIRMGDTRLLFVALCGERFGWIDRSGS